MEISSEKLKAKLLRYRSVWRSVRFIFSSEKFSLLFSLTICFSFLFLSACGQGNGEASGKPLFDEEALPITMEYGNGLLIGRSKIPAQDLIVKISEPSSNKGMQDLPVEFKQLTSTDMQLFTTETKTDSDGRAKFSIRAPSTYATEFKVEARLKGSSKTVAVFTMHTISDLPTSLEWEVPPPDTSRLASTAPLPAFKARLLDEAGDLINTNNTSTMTLSVFSGTGALSGTLTSTSVGGIVTFTGVGYNVSETMILRGTLNSPAIHLDKSIIFESGDAHHFNLSGPTQIKSGTCAGPYTFQIRDEFENPTSFSLPKTVALTPGTGAFYTANTCGGAPVTSVPVSVGQQSGQLYFKTNIAGSTTLSLTNTTGIILIPGTLNIVATPDRMILTGPATLRADECGILTITSKDTAANTAAVYANVTLSLTGGGANGAFYALADTTCSGAAITSVLFPNAQSSVQVRYKDSKGRSATLNVADGLSYYLGSSLTFDVGPKLLELTGSVQYRAGDCNLYTINTKDGTNTLVALLSAKTINLTQGAATGNFYSAADTTCSGATITSVAIASASSSQTFRYKNNTAANFTLTATDSSAYLTAGTLSQTGSPRQLYFSGNASIAANLCSVFTITAKDAALNAAPVLSAVTLSLSDDSATGQFYALADTTCSGAAITTATIANGTTNTQVRFMDTGSGAKVLTVADAASYLIGNTYNINVGPDRIQITGTQNILASSCSQFTVSTVDSSLLPAGVNSATQINLTTASASGKFYASTDTTCAGAQISSLSFLTGESTKNFRYKDQLAEDTSLTATDNAAFLIPKTYNITVGPDRIISSANTSTRADDCELITLTTKDTLGNVANVYTNTTINLSKGAALGSFYSAADTTCSGAAITSVQITSGASTTSFRFKDPKAEVVTIASDDVTTTLNSGSSTITVGPRNLILTGASPIKGADCQVYTITSRDAQGTAANVLASTTINLSDAAASGNFYLAADTTCTGATQTSVALNAASTKTFRYKDDKAESLTLTIADNASYLIGSTLNVDVGPNHLAWTGTTPIRAGDCTIFTVALKDAQNTSTTALFPITVNLTEGAASGNYYADTDTTCSGATQTSVTYNIGDSVKTLYYKDNKSENVALLASDAAAALTASTYNLVVGPRKINISGPAAIFANQCVVYTTSFEDQNGTAANALSNNQVNLTTTSGTALFYAIGDTTCSGAPITSVVVASGASSVQYRIKDLVSQSLSITNTDQNAILDPKTLNLYVGADHLAVTGPTQPRSGDCSLFTVYTKDTSNNISAPSSDTTINLADGAASGSFYGPADSTCAGATVSSGVITTAQNSLNFYYKDLKAEAATLTITDASSSLTATSANLTVGPRQMVITGPATVRSGDCDIYTITSQDLQGTNANVFSTLAIGLTDATGQGDFYASTDTTCAGAQITSASILAATNNIQFRYKNPVAEAVVFTAHDATTTLSDATFNVTAGPQSYQLTGLTPARAGECGLYTVTTKDSAGNTANALSALTVNQLVDSVATGDFYAAADTTCVGAPVTSVTVGTGTSSTTFRWKDTKAENVTLSVDDGVSGLNAGTLAVAVGPNKLILSGASPIRSGDCTAYTVTSKDTLNNASNVLANVTVNLTKTGSGGFYSDAGCGSSITSTTIASGTSASTFYFLDNVAEVQTFTVADNNAAYLTGSTLAVTTGPKYYELTGLTPSRAGECGLYTVTSKDAAGTAANALSALTLNQLVDSVATGDFYAAADTTCAGAAITSVNVGTGTSSTTFRWKDTKAENVTLSVDDGVSGLDAGTLAVAVGPNKMVLTGTTPIIAGQCGLYTITTKDTLNNPYNVINNLNINLNDGATGGAFYDPADTTCTGSTITTRSILAGGNSVNFRYKNTTGQSLTLNSDDQLGYIASGSLAITVGPSKIILTGATPIRSGDCTAYTVTSKDENNNAKNALSTLTVNLSKSGGSGAFYSNAGCTTSTSTATITSGTSTGTFYFINNVAEAQTLTVADNGAVLAGSSLAVTTGPQKFQLTGLTPSRAGECGLYTITTLDAANNSANALSALTVNQLVDSVATGDFYAAADTTCVGAPVTSVTVGTGTSSTTFRWKDTKAENVTLSVDDGGAGLNAGTLAVSVGPDRIILSGTATIRSGDCTAYTVTSQDTLGNATNTLSTVTVNLSKSGGSGAFYSNAGCTTSTATATITSGTSSATFYFINNVAESQTLTVADNNSAYLTGSSLAVTTGTRALALTGPTPSRAGDCNLLTITSKDQAGNTTNALANIVVNSLSVGGGSGQFYAAADTTCSGAAATTATILSGTSSITLRYKDNVAETKTLTVDDGAGGVDPGTLSFQTGPDRIILSGATPIRAGDCTAYTVTSKDTAGNTKNTLSTVTVNLSKSGGSGAFYSNAGCTTSTSTATITSGTSSGTFYFINNVAEAQTLTVADNNAAYLAGSSLVVTTGTRALALTGPTPSRAGDCNLLTITSKDQAGNTTNALSNIVVNSLSVGGGSGQFYAAADTTCTGAAATSVTILSGTNNITVRYKDNVAETKTLTVDDGAGGVDPGTLSFQTGPSKMVLTGASPIRANDCTLYTVTSKDVSNNTKNVIGAVTVNLTKNGSGGFYSNAACTLSVTTTTISAGTSAGTFYFKDDLGETQTLTVADNNAAYLAGSTLSVTTGPLNYQLTGLTPSRAGECGLYTITTKDFLGNTTNATSALTINQLVDSVATGNFYAAADTTCVGGTISSLAIASGASSTTFRWMDTKSENVTLSVDDGAGGLNAGTLAVVVGPNKMVISGTTPIIAGQCGLYTITTKDTLNNAANLVNNLNINLNDGATGGAFYDPADTTCTGSTITTRSILSGASTVNFRYKNTTGQSLTLNSDDQLGYIASGSLAITVGPSKIILAGATPIRSGDCTAYTVTSKDENNNAKNALSTLTVNLSKSGGSGAFYSNAGCTTSTSTATITSGTSTGTFYFINNVAEAQTLTVADNAAVLAGSSLAVTTGPRKLALTGTSPSRAGDCNLLTVTVKDQANNTTNALSDIIVNSLSNGAGSGQFYAAADTTCTGSTITSVTVTTGTNNITLRYKDNVAETKTLTVDDGAGGVDPGTLSFQTGPDRIILSGATPIRAGDCTAYTVTAKDASGNTKNTLSTVTVNLSKSGGSGAFYSNAGCTTSTSTATITSGTSSGTFYFINNVAEVQTLTVADNNAAYLTGSSLAVTTGTRYLSLTGTTPARAGDCNLLTITSKDQAGNTTNALANIVVNTLSVGGGSGQFYAAADTTCSGAAATSVTILSGTNNITIRYKDNVAETKTLSVDDGAGGVDPGTLSFQTGPDRIILSGATPIRSGDCTMYTVTSKDVAGNATNALSTVTVNLSKSGGSGAFYSNAGCTISTSTATITSGTSAGTFYFINNVAEVQTLTVADNNAGFLTGSSLAVTTGPKYYQLTGLTPTRAGECGLYTITTKDAATNTANAVTALTVNQLVDSVATGDFYAAADTTCAGAPVTSVSVGIGTSSTTFRWKDAKAENVTLSVDDGVTGLDAGTYAVVVGPNKLVISGNNVLSQDGCGLFTITSKDTLNNSANVLSNTTINLTKGAAVGSFYDAADTTCVGAPITTASIANGSATTTFRYRDATQEVTTMSADDNAAYLASGSFQVEVGSDRFDLVVPATARAGECLGGIVYLRDQTNALNPAQLLSSFTFGVGAASMTFYAAADTTCAGAPITGITINPGDTTFPFNFKDNRGQNVTLTIDDGAGGRTAVNSIISVGPNHLTITGAVFPSINACVPYTVHSQDLVPTDVGVLTATTVNLSGLGSGVFYSDVACTAGNEITSTTLGIGTGSKLIYLKDATSELLTLAADDPTVYLTGGTLAIETGASLLEITGTASYPSSTCSLYTVTSKNAALAAQNVLANATVNLTRTGLGSFYAAADTTCSGGTISNVVISAGTNSNTFRFKDTTAEASVITAASTNRTSGTFNVTTLASRLAWQLPNKIPAGVCNLLTIRSTDELSNFKTVTGNVTVNLSSGGSSGSFYAAADTTCSGGTVTSVTLSSGTDTVQVRFKDDTGENKNFTASDNAAVLTSGITSFKIGPHHLTVTGNSPIRTGDCELYTVTSEDFNNVATNVYGLTTVDLTGAGTGAFYAAADTTCVGAPITSISIGLGTNNSTYRYKISSAATNIHSAADNAGILVTGTLSVKAGPRNLVLTGTTTISANSCNLYTATAKDDSNAAAGVSAITQVNLSSNGGGSFYAPGDTTCSGATITNISLASAASSGTFRFKNSTAGALTLTIADNAASLNSGTLALTVGPDRLVITGTTSFKAGTCQVYTVTSKDGGNVTTNVTSTTTVNINDGAAAGNFFAAADTTCTGGAISNVSIANGSSSTTFRYKDNKGETGTLNADDGAGILTSGTLAYSVGPSRLIISSATSVNTGDCTLYTVTTKDELPAAANALANITANLSGASLGVFYDAADTTCSGAAITSVTVNAASSSAQFRYKNNSPESVTLTSTDAGANLTTGTLGVTVNDNCIVNNYLVEAMVTGSPVATVVSGSTFDVRVTARDVGNVTRSCFTRSKNLTWTMNANAAVADCGAPNGTPVSPTETSLTFVNGVATTTSNLAMFKAVQADAKIQVSDGTVTSNSSNIAVTAGTVCRIKLATAPGAGTPVITTSNIDLNVNSGTANSQTTVYAAGFDQFGNYVADQTVVWSGDAYISPLAFTNNVASDMAKVVGTRIGSGTLQADYAGGGGTKTATVAFTVSSTNAVGTVTGATTDLGGSNFLASGSVLATAGWDTTTDAVTAWKTNSALSWYLETPATNVRGLRQAFPNRVGLVGSAGGLDIIDMNSNQLWMRFTLGAGNLIDSNIGSITSISALNGKIFVGQSTGGNNGSLVVIDLANDSAKRYNIGGEYNYGGTIAQRNAGSAYSLNSGAKALAGSDVYSVKARRIGGADYAIVGTTGGASLYQNNGAVSIYSDTTTNPVTAVAIASDGKVYYAENNFGVYRADLTLPLAASFTDSRSYTGTSAGEIQSLTINSLDIGEGVSSAQAGSHTLSVGHSNGLSVIQEHSTAASSTSKTYVYRGTGTFFSGVLKLDSSSSYAQVNSGGSNLGPGSGNSVTVEMFFRPDTSITATSPVLYQRGSGNSSFKMGFNSGRLECLFIDSFGASQSVLSATSSWTSGTWNHAACVINAASIEIFVNGNREASTPINIATESITNAVATIGADSAFTNNFNGAIDELRVSKTARYSTATYTVPAVAFTSDANTVSLFHFNETSGIIASHSDTDALQDANLSGTARLVTPLLAGSSSVVKSVQANVSGGNLTLDLVTSGASGAWSELNSAQTATATLSGSATAINGIGICIYQNDGLNTSDLLIGLTSGYQLRRR